MNKVLKKLSNVDGPCGTSPTISGASANAEEQQAENQRRAQHDANTLRRQQATSSTLRQGSNIPIIPSIPTSHSRRPRSSDLAPGRVLSAPRRAQYDSEARQRQQGEGSSSGQQNVGSNTLGEPSSSGQQNVGSSTPSAPTSQSRRLRKPKPTFRRSRPDGQ